MKLFDRPLLIGIAVGVTALAVLTFADAQTKHTNQDPQLHGNNGLTTETALLALTFDAATYGIMLTDGWLADGYMFSVPLFETVLIPGDEIVDGIFWAPLGMIIETDTCSLDTSKSTVIEFITMTKAKKIRVTCGDGYYACCTCQDGCALALCRNYDDPDPVYPCEGGGRGSTECEIECNDHADDL